LAAIDELTGVALVIGRIEGCCLGDKDPSDGSDEGAGGPRGGGGWAAG